MFLSRSKVKLERFHCSPKAKHPENKEINKNTCHHIYSEDTQFTVNKVKIFSINAMAPEGYFCFMEYLENNSGLQFSRSISREAECFNQNHKQ